VRNAPRQVSIDRESSDGRIDIRPDTLDAQQLHARSHREQLDRWLEEGMNL